MKKQTYTGRMRFVDGEFQQEIEVSNTDAGGTEEPHTEWITAGFDNPSSLYAKWKHKSAIFQIEKWILSKGVEELSKKEFDINNPPKDDKMMMRWLLTICTHVYSFLHYDKVEEYYRWVLFMEEKLVKHSDFKKPELPL